MTISSHSSMTVTPGFSRWNVTRSRVWRAETAQRCYVWHQSGSYWSQVEQIRDFFRSDFSQFWRGAVIWKSSGFVPFGANLTHFGAKTDISEATASFVCGLISLHEFISVDHISFTTDTFTENGWFLIFKSSTGVRDNIITSIST